MEMKEGDVKQGVFAQWETLRRLLYNPVRFEAVILQGQVFTVLWLKRKHGFFQTFLDRFGLARSFGSFYYKELPKEVVLIIRFLKTSAGEALRNEVQAQGCDFVSKWPIDAGHDWNLVGTFSAKAWVELKRLHPEVTDNLALSKLLKKTLSFEVLYGWASAM